MKTLAIATLVIAVAILAVVLLKKSTVVLEGEDGRRYVGISSKLPIKDTEEETNPKVVVASEG